MIDYNSTDFGEELRGEDFDVVYDCVGGEQQWISSQKLLKQNGQFITIAGDDTESVLTLGWMWTTLSKITSRKFWSVFSSAHHAYTMHGYMDSSRTRDNLKVNFIENGKVKPIIDAVRDWRVEGAEALYSLFERSRSGKAQGKLILKIAD